MQSAAVIYSKPINLIRNTTCNEMHKFVRNEAIMILDLICAATLVHCNHVLQRS